MKNREAIYKSLELIEENLHSDMTVYAISQKFGFSYYYFSRLFKGITGFNPKAYILNRKITESVNDVIKTDKKIIEIALDYGFSTPESFSRAFQKVTDTNPSELRKLNQFNTGRLFHPLTREKIEYHENTLTQKPELVTCGPILLVGLPFYYEMEWKNDLTNPWQKLINNISLLTDRITPERYYQVQYWFADQDAGSLFFFLGIQVKQIQEIPIQFTAKILPRQNYLKFLHTGRSNTVGKTYEYIYEKWLPETEYSLPHLFNFEFYGDRFKGPYSDDSISEIYIPVEIGRPASKNQHIPGQDPYADPG